MKLALLLVAGLVIVVSAAIVLADVAFQNTTVVRHTFEGPIRSIVVRVDSGDIELVPAPGLGVRARESRHYTFKTPSFTAGVRDGVLRIAAAGCEAAFVTCRTDLRLTVPDGIAVVAQSDSGDVVARGIDVARARLDSDSGAVRAGLRGHQQLVQAHSDSGDVDVRAGDARAIDAQTDSGDVVVAAAGAPRRIVAITDSGDVRVVAPAGEYRVDAQSDSGDVKLKRISRNDRAGRSIEAHTDSGDVTLEGG
jgi:hypothetical protein